jgi:hypothetical protein
MFALDAFGKRQFNNPDYTGTNKYCDESTPALLITDMVWRFVITRMNDDFLHQAPK